MRPEEVFEQWVKLRAGKHFEERHKQNEYEAGGDEFLTYEEEWLGLVLLDWDEANKREQG